MKNSLTRVLHGARNIPRPALNNNNKDDFYVAVTSHALTRVPHKQLISYRLSYLKSI